MRVDGAGDVDGIGAGVGIDNDFNAVFGAQEFDDVGHGGARFERVQAGGDRGRLKFAANVFRHAGGFGEAADRAADRRSEPRVGIKMESDALEVSCHGHPQD